MRVVLDTNVLISGIYFGGIPKILIDIWKQGKINYMLTVEIYDEYKRVDNAIRSKYPNIMPERIIELVGEKSAFLIPIDAIHEECPDVNDYMFINCALSSKTKTINSGDEDLLSMNGYRGLEVLKPRKFLEKYFKSAINK